MGTRETIEQILTDGCRAPSADNTQPWRFIVKDNVIQVINTGGQKESIFNYRQMVNHASIGACIENLCISSENKGFRYELQFFPDANNLLIVAEVALIPATASRNNLALTIDKRSSNRKKYHSKQINSEAYEELSSLTRNDEGRISFISNKTEVTKLASIVSAGEKLALENESIHNFLFEHVTWSKEEDTKKHGFFIDTFEFAPPQKILFKLFRNWSVLKWFVPLGFPDFVAKDMAKVYSTSAAFGLIVSKDNSAETYVKAGMLFERIWLTATELGLSLQPTTGLVFFAQPVLEEDPFELSDKTVGFIKGSYVALKQVTKVGQKEHVTMLFRIGYADAPTARTTRFEPKVTFED